MKIEEDFRPTLSVDLPDNPLFNDEFIKYLQNNFMPYIFIWAGYIFRGLTIKGRNGETITHTTQGSIEKHWKSKIANGHKGLYPAEYAEEAISVVLASCQADKSTVLKKSSNEKSKQLN